MVASRLKLGMVGGGEGAFIGGVHRFAARLDGAWDLVAGNLSSTPEKAARSAEVLGLARSYGSFEDMARAEAARDDGIDAVAIVTPNHMHLPIARAFLRQGIHVICDKPLCTDLAEAEAFAEFCRTAPAKFFLTHNYIASPLVRQAREMVQRGDLGRIRLVHAEYLQDWLAEPAEAGNPQAAWRTDPARSGRGGAIADIGTHAYNLACFVTGETPNRLSADLTSFVEGRAVNDNGSVMLRFASGARGSLLVSQVATGMENHLSLRIHGDKGALRWAQETPNEMFFTPLNGVEQRLTRGGAGAGAAANAVTRIPAGHPEGYLEAFATLYLEIAQEIRSGAANPALTGVEEAVAGMRFLEACLHSSAQDAAWQDF